MIEKKERLREYRFLLLWKLIRSISLMYSDVINRVQGPMGRISLPHPKKTVDSAGNAFYISYQSYVRREPPRLIWAAFFILLVL